MICEAAFMGGPVNGQIRAFPGDEPPSKVVVHSAPRIPWRQWDPDLGGFVTDDPEVAREPLHYTEHTYRREVSQMDDGPLWVFVHVEPESSKDPLA